MRIFLFMFIVALAVTSAQAQRSKSVLLSDAEAKKAAGQCSRPSPRDFTDTCKPNPKQLRKMETRLKEIAKLTVEDCCIIGVQIEDPEAWYLQYAALERKGRKIIYISGISREKPENGPCFDENGILIDEKCEVWKHRAEIVCDGGTQWGVIYDVESGKFSDLAINGIA